MGIFLDNYILKRDIFNVLSPEAGGPNGTNRPWAPDISPPRPLRSYATAYDFAMAGHETPNRDTAAMCGVCPNFYE
jgi:hypothetical protein